MPRISVIMGVYNGEKRLGKAVKSILNQTMDDIELIICNDGSSDNSGRLIKEMALKDSRIRYLENEKNIGLAGALNRCIEVAKGEYIARMDDDDISHKDRLEKQMDFLDKNLEYDILGTGRYLYDNDGVWGKGGKEGEVTKLDIIRGSTFVHPTVMLRRETLLKAGGYSTGREAQRTEDYDLWCRLYGMGYKGYNLEDLLLDYYEARDSYSKRKFKYRICESRLKWKWRKKYGLSARYSVYALRPWIVGLMPAGLKMTYHRHRYSLNQ